MTNDVKIAVSVTCLNCYQDSIATFDSVDSFDTCSVFACPGCHGWDGGDDARDFPGGYESHGLKVTADFADAIGTDFDALTDDVLTDLQKSRFVSYYVDGESTGKIADASGVARGSVSNSIGQARSKIEE